MDRPKHVLIIDGKHGPWPWVHPASEACIEYGCKKYEDR